MKAMRMFCLLLASAGFAQAEGVDVRTAEVAPASAAPAPPPPSAPPASAAPAPAAPRPMEIGRAWWSVPAERGWLGVQMSSKPEATRSYEADEIPEAWLAVLNLEWLVGKWDGQGALVLTVTPESPAERAGILPGDVILSFNGIRTRSPGELAFVVQRAMAGHDGDLDVLRDDETRRLLVEIGMHPEDRRRLEEEREARERELARTGTAAPDVPAERK